MMSQCYWHVTTCLYIMISCSLWDSTSFDYRNGKYIQWQLHDIMSDVHCLLLNDKLWYSPKMYNETIIKVLARDRAQPVKITWLYNSFSHGTLLSQFTRPGQNIPWCIIKILKQEQMMGHCIKIVWYFSWSVT